MSLSRTHLLWSLVALAVLPGYLSLTGCKATTPPAKEQQSTKAEEHDHEHERAHEQKPDNEQQRDEQSKEKAGPQPPQTLEQAIAAAHSPTPEERMNGMQLLGQFMDRGTAEEAAKARAELLKAAKEDPEPEVRAAAVAAFSNQADKEYEFLAHYADDPESAVRTAALKALGGSSPGSKGEAKLIEVSKTGDAATKAAAVDALTYLRSQHSDTELAGLVSQLGDPEGDASAKAAIEVKLKGAVALPYLREVLNTSKNPRQRHAAAMCVALICAGKNPRQQAFAASVKATHREAKNIPDANLAGLPILEKAIRDPEPMVREIAAQGLGYLGSDRCAAPLAAALKDPDTFVRRRAASALVTTPAKSVQKQIAEAATTDPDPTVRRYAIEALGWIGDETVVGALTRGTKDPSPDVRRHAAIQLGRIRRPEALDPLLNLFTDPDEDVRWAAVQAVGNLRDRRATPYLVKALNDPVAQVANAAETALTKLGIATRKLPGAD